MTLWVFQRVAKFRIASNMFLMFGLSRPDVLSVGDNGVRVGVQTAFGLTELPHEKQPREIAEPWAPYRSVASWYLWRSLEPVNQANGGE